MLILIVDDHPLVCSALEATLRSVLQDCEILQAHAASEALALVEARQDIDLVMLDLKLPDVHGMEGLQALRKAAPRLPILVLSGLDDARLIEMVRRNGALGFINKTSCAQSIVAAVRAVLEGDMAFAEPAGTCGEHGDDHMQIAQAIESLTPQQHTVLRMLGEGLLNKQIAYELSISESTVKGHVSAILRKFEVPSRMQAVLMAQRTMLDQNLGLKSASARDVSMSR